MELLFKSNEKSDDYNYKIIKKHDLYYVEEKKYLFWKKIVYWKKAYHLDTTLGKVSISFNTFDEAEKCVKILILDRRSSIIEKIRNNKRKHDKEIIIKEYK